VKNKKYIARTNKRLTPKHMWGLDKGGHSEYAAESKEAADTTLM